MTVVAIHQPNFMPWLGYFHKLIHCDIFIFLDDAQFPRGKSFTSRVTIKTPTGPAWLTVPVKGKGDMSPIKDVLTNDTVAWKKKHLRTLEACYGRTAFFQNHFPFIEQAYQKDCRVLADFNMKLITTLAGCFSSVTRMVKASELGVEDSGSLGRLIKLVKSVGGTQYLTGTGKGSLRYLDEEAFAREGIEVLYQSFVHPVYPQQWGEFLPNLSAIDLLFNCGKEGKKFLQATNMC